MLSTLEQLLTQEPYGLWTVVGCAILALAHLCHYLEGRLPFLHRVVYTAGHLCFAVALWKVLELLTIGFIATSAQHFGTDLLGFVPQGTLFPCYLGWHAEVGLFAFAMLISRPAWAWIAVPFIGGICVDSGLTRAAGSMTIHNSSVTNASAELPRT